MSDIIVSTGRFTRRSDRKDLVIRRNGIEVKNEIESPMVSIPVVMFPLSSELPYSDYV